jgi:adenylate kinase
MQQSKTIFFIGPAGSGKGTQAKILANKIKAEYIEMGALLRKVAAEDSDFGRSIKKTIDAGVLVDDDVWKKVISQKLESLDSSTPAIFDGTPRRVTQAEKLIDYLKSIGRNNIISMYISLPRAESVKRLLARGRNDDYEKAINERLDLYEQDTFPTIDYLRKTTELHEIDGTPDIAEVTKEIDKALGI